MLDMQNWMIVPDNAMASALILFVIAMPFLYAARRLVHELVRSVGHAAGGPLRLGSRWLFAAAAEMRERNRRCCSRTGARRRAAHRARVRAHRRPGDARPARATRRCSASCSRRSRASRRTTRSAARCRRRRPSGSRRSPRSRKIKSDGNEMVQRILEEIKPLGRGHPRQGPRRVPPRLRVAPQDPRTASCRSGARSTRPSGRWTRSITGPRGHVGQDRRADGEVRADRQEDRQGASRR